MVLVPRPSGSPPPAAAVAESPAPTGALSAFRSAMPSSSVATAKAAAPQ